VFISFFVASALVGLAGYNLVSSSSVPISAVGFWYEAGGTFQLDLWTVDPAGEPYAHVSVSLQVLEVLGGNFTTIPPVDVLGLSQSSDSQGQVAFVVPDHLPSNASYQVTLGIEGTGSGEIFGLTLENQSSGAPQPVFNPFREVSQDYYTTDPRLAVVWAGEDGSLPTGDMVLACAVPSSYYGGLLTTTNCSTAADTTSLGTLTGYLSYVPVPPPTPADNLTTYWTEIVEVTNSTGAVVTTSTLSNECDPLSCGGANTPGPGLLNSYAIETGLLLPLLALLIAYGTYATPRLTGTLDSILVRPITRRGLFAVRWGTITGALLGVALVEVALLGAEASSLLREPVPAVDLAAITAGLTVATLAIVGLVFVFAHLFRTPGPVLASSLGVVIVTSVSWGLILDLVWSAFFGPFDASGFATLSLQLELLAPSQYPSLAVGLLTGESYAASGVTGWVIAVVGIAWVAIPTAIAYWRAVTRD